MKLEKWLKKPKSKRVNKISHLKDEIMILFESGYSLSIIQDFLKKEENIEITRQSINSFINRVLKENKPTVAKAASKPLFKKEVAQNPTKTPSQKSFENNTQITKRQASDYSPEQKRELKEAMMAEFGEHFKKF